jgi:hypothetical protein
MTIRSQLELDILSYWHAGTGKGAGAVLDALCHRTAEGLPFLPGRTVRGLLREALQRAVDLQAIAPASWGGRPAVEWAFGTGVAKGRNEDRVNALEEMRFTSTEGNLRVSSAVLGKSDDEARRWQTWAKRYPPKLEHLFRPFASTKVADDGKAADKTLRATEVAVPMQLYAWVEGPDGEPWQDALPIAAHFIRGLGSHRNRGLGRVAVTVRSAPVVR